MSDSQNAGFGKFIPGFDFLQSLTKGAAESVPNLGSWIAPTLSVEELDKRISELKTVHFWLEQNSKALGATVQALEVQKMTLMTLKNMNFNIGEMANALKPKAAEKASPPSKTVAEVAAEADAAAAKAAAQEREAAAKAEAPASEAASAAAPGLVDPMQLWGALTHQFQNIAAGALKEVSQNAAVSAATNLVADLAKEAAKVTKTATANASKPKAAAKSATQAPAKKAAAKKTPAKTPRKSS